MLSDHGCVTSHWDSIPLLIKGRRSNPCKLTLRKHKWDRNGKGVLRSCPPTLPCLRNNFACLWQLLTPCLHRATLWASPPHVSVEPASEHSETFSYWGQSWESSQSNEIWEQCWALCRKSCFTETLENTGCWAPAHVSSDPESHWPPAEHTQGQPEPLTHIVMQKREEGDGSPPNGGASNQGSSSGSFWMAWNKYCNLSEPQCFKAVKLGRWQQLLPLRSWGKSRTRLKWEQRLLMQGHTSPAPGNQNYYNVKC